VGGIGVSVGWAVWVAAKAAWAVASTSGVGVPAQAEIIMLTITPKIINRMRFFIVGLLAYMSSTDVLLPLTILSKIGVFLNSWCHFNSKVIRLYETIGGTT